MEQALKAFCQMLSDTPLSLMIQSVGWIIPMMQSAHIIAITLVMGSVLMTDMKLLGVVGHGVTVRQMNRRFLPWIWGALVALLLTGTVLTIAEPARELINNVFRLKMLLILVIATATGVFHKFVEARADDWDNDARSRWPARAFALLSIAAWVSIVICGRWIAYAEHG